jgi:WD40 repeat protein
LVFKSGDLCYYDLESDQKWQTFTTHSSEELFKGHCKIIYDIISYKSNLITISLDKLINLWDLTTKSQLKSFTTLNSFVYSIANSPINQTTCAISTGEPSIKLINQNFAKSFNNNLKSEITQVKKPFTIHYY